jgi:hypothetical protein
MVGMGGGFRGCWGGGRGEFEPGVDDAIEVEEKRGEGGGGVLVGEGISTKGPKGPEGALGS